MINRQLIEPSSIAIIGGSNDVSKPGGKIVKNILTGNFEGELFVVNKKEQEVQGIKCYPDVKELPDVELAILAIPAHFCVEAVDILANKKGTRAFIIISAGFSEHSKEGALIEKEIVRIIESVDGVLIGPNGIGILTPAYNGVFTEPIPQMNPNGVDLVSGSGATAVYILDSGMQKGLSFACVVSVGNSAQVGVEEVLEYMDLNFDPEKSSKIKLLYLEKIEKPEKLLKHASSLIKKGCKIAAIKSGSSEAGSRAASSHTGALASSDTAVDALFRKAGIVRCYGREELTNVGCAFVLPRASGKRFAVITHAGGPAVMLTDTLSKNGLEIPEIKNEYISFLLDELFPGSSVSNPIDFLATGTAEQLGTILEYVNKKFEEIDAMVVIFGSPGLFKIFDVYELLHAKMMKSQKPIYPVLPSVEVASEEINNFISKGNVYFSDEVILGEALGKIYGTPEPAGEATLLKDIDTKKIREVIDNSSDGYLSPDDVQVLIDACNIPRVKEQVVSDKTALLEAARSASYPLVMKVVGPVHKSDVGGVTLNIDNDEFLMSEFDRMMKIKEATGVLLQPMLSGIELFMGANYEPPFGHLILCGLGGIFIEILKDVASGLAPLNKKEAHNMVQSLKSYKLFKGARGQEPIDEELFVDIMLRLSTLLHHAPEIKELDFNPLLAKGKQIVVVDSRIRIAK
ncbi:MAG: CoA-binding protein [Chloroflexia bacterium]|nr:CoA-binding protein [Chloroflexia bacterium]